MIKNILEMLPYVDEGKYVEIAKGKNNLPTNWQEFKRQIKNIKNGTRNS
tara:strand:- start:2004 stop:2150 length:147 start_codon:yes stop_codon:yes gene_type:complete